MLSLAHVGPWASLLLLLFLAVVNGMQEQDAVHHGLTIEADGHVSAMHASKGGHMTIESGGVMRREGMSDHHAVEGPKVLNHKSGRHLQLSLAPNATGQLMQTPVLEEGLKCNSAIFAPADKCPFECPYMAEDTQYICHFRCLAVCGTLDPLANVADEQDMICRRCRVDGCTDCIPGKKDTCRKCAVGYTLAPNGTCDTAGHWIMFVVKVVLALILLTFAFWLLELATRKRTNWRGFRTGSAFRWRTRVHMPLGTTEEDGVDDTENLDENIHELLLYPLSTNLLRQPVAGPGLTLHFNFFLAVLIWSAVIIYMYAFAATLVSVDMLVLGLSPAKTSQQLCSVVHWGHDAQMRLIWAKTGFVAFAYVFTFLGCLYLAWHQKQVFARLDDEPTLKDFVAYAHGLPKLKGSEDAEEELRLFLEEQTQQRVRGVSICWNYTSHDKEVMQAIEADWKEREEALAPVLPEDPILRQPRLGFFRRQLRKIDCLMSFDPPSQDVPDEPTDAGSRRGTRTSGTDATPLLGAPGSAAVQSGPSESDVRKMLVEMESSDVAFIVFDTEEQRDAAVEDIKLKDGLEYKGSSMNLEIKYCEPESARFQGLCYGSNRSHRANKMRMGAGYTLIALLLWAGVFYFPYAYYMITFSYAQGQSPPMFATQLFTILVVAGNQLMYYLADVISTGADFEFEDEREVAYNWVYVAACVLNTILDLVVTLWLAFRMMVGMGIHTADNRLVGELTSLQDIFESYPVQKVFGDLLYVYSFPACFLYPFILEVVVSLVIPYYICKYIVLSHDEVQGREAELSMQFFMPMNLGRYGDIILNMILCVMVFFCPGGFTLPMFIAFFFCHCGLYMYDHWRILRMTPNFNYAQNSVDNFGQLQLMIPTGILAMCLVFRFSQASASLYLDGAMLYVSCLLAFCAHCLLHWLCLTYLVPMFEEPPHDHSKISYAEVAKNKPLTWFSANPVHCLRSKYIRKDSPPSILCINGKEHLQKANEEIGAYFEDASYAEAYTLAKSVMAEENDAIQEDKEEKLKKDENDEPAWH